jgi:cellulose synthase/poly-beta-1,6-N-acetylglucosamine synthase-like glycosyltransferase
LPKDDKKPKVSVIIPAYNEEAHILSCLEAIQKQDFRGNMEVIVVNDGSTDRTAEIASKYPVNLIDLKTNRGKANALNVGIKHSKGDILVFSDSDSEIADSAVNLLVNSLEEHPDAGAVAGQVYVKAIKGKNNLLKRFQMMEYEIDQGLSRYLQGLNGNVQVCPGPLFAVRREIAEKTMFSNRTVIEDADFTIEILKNNMKVLHEPRAKVYTNPPVSLKGWFNQRKRWMYGNLQLWRVHKQWARKNPWMILNYFGFITALTALILILLLPYLLSTYDSINFVLLRAIAYTAAPILLFTLLIMPFFIKNRRLLLTIIPYILLYGTIKAVTLSYVYLRYIFRRGVKVTFGSRTMLVR